MSRRKIIIPKTEIERLYWQKGWSPARIGRFYCCDGATIRSRMKELGIEKRTPAQARMRYKKNDFSGDAIEKAYIIGFRLGDMNVYQVSPDSELVVARSNTTQNVQVNLIEELFAPYGKVTISYGEKSVNVNCFLNRSFLFLLPKNADSLRWIEKNIKTSAAFIAGYTDAEGNFIINQNRARFKIDSYDDIILHWIHGWCLKRKIKSKLRRIGEKNKQDYSGKKYKYDLWRLNINDAQSLLRFIQMIKPHIKHGTRLQHLSICEQNIYTRFHFKQVR